MPINVADRVVFDQPKEWDQRREIATACCQRLDLGLPTVVDDMNDTVDTLYAGWPERLYVIDAAGRIAYAGRRGPWGFKPEEVEAWLKQNAP